MVHLLYVSSALFNYLYVTISSLLEEPSEDLMIALRKRAEIEPKHLVTFVQNDASDLRQSLNK